MHITAERAFWILDYYRRHAIVLTFGGRILDEEGACRALISHVAPDSQTIAIKLLGHRGEEAWDQLIRLERATFFLIQMGDPEFDQFKILPCHSILIVGFCDGTTMFFAEPLRGDSPQRSTNLPNPPFLTA